MRAMDKILILIGGLIGCPLLCWLLIGLIVGRGDYVGLATASLLLVATGGLAWGFVCRHPGLILVGLLLLLIGILLTFALDGSSGPILTEDSETLRDMKAGLDRPVNSTGTLRLWHLGVAGLLALDALLLGRGADWRRIVGGSMLFAVWVSIVALLAA